MPKLDINPTKQKEWEKRLKGMYRFYCELPISDTPEPDRVPQKAPGEVMVEDASDSEREEQQLRVAISRLSI